MANVSDELQELRKRARRRLVGAIALVIFALTVLWTALDGEPPKSLLESQSVEIISSAPALSSVVTQTPLEVASAASAVVSATVASSAAEQPMPTVHTVDASHVAPIALPGKLVSHQEKAPRVVPDATSLQAEDSGVTKPTVKPVIKPTSKPSPKPTAKPQSTKAPADPKAILEGATVGKAPDVKTVDAKPEKSNLYYIQIGAYADESKAQQTLKKLTDAGIPARSEKVSTPKGELTRVRIGPGHDEAKAKAWLQRLDALGVPGKLIVQAAP